MPAKLSKEACQKWIDLNRPGFELVKLVGSYTDSLNTYKHEYCGKKFKQTNGSFRLSKHCPLCAGRFGSKLHRNTLEDTQKAVNAFYGKNHYTVLEYKHSMQPVKVRHKCGHVYKARNYSNFVCGGYRCPICFLDCNHGSRIQEITIKGRTFRVQGYEAKTLKELLKKYKPKDIQTGSALKNRFRLRYKYASKWKFYCPDFYLPKQNLIIEVKGLATLGLTSDKSHPFGKGLYLKNRAKAKKCIDLGYDFRMDLYNDDRKIKLPSNWYEYSRQDLAAKLQLNT